MAHDFRLARGPAGRSAPLRRRPPRRVSEICTSRKIDAGDAVAAELEDQRLFVIETAIAGDGRQLVVARAPARGGTALIVHGHDSTSASALAKASQVFVGVGFGGGHDQQIARGRFVRQQARGGHAGENAFRRQRIDDLGGGLGQLQREFVEEGRRDQRRRPSPSQACRPAHDALA